MARVVITKNLQRHVACPPEEVVGETVRAALEAYFAKHPGVRAYVLDEQGGLRHHVVIFVDGQQMRDRAALSEPLHSEAEVYIMQALSGG